MHENFTHVRKARVFMGIRRIIIILGVTVSGGISIHHGCLKGIFPPFLIGTHTHTRTHSVQEGQIAGHDARWHHGIVGGGRRCPNVTTHGRMTYRVVGV